MIDTGSTISAINAAYVKRLNLHHRVRSTDMLCKTANSKHLRIGGKLTLTIMIADQHIRLTTFLIEGLCADLLLGGDFCLQHGVQIDYDKRRLHLQVRQRQVIVPFQSQAQEHQVFFVYTNETIVLPPLSSMTIAANSKAPSMQAVFTPTAELSRKHSVSAPHALVTVKHNQSVVLSLFNPSSIPQTIPAGTRVGHLQLHSCAVVQCPSIDTAHTTPHQRPIRTTTSPRPPPSMVQLENLVKHLSKPQQPLLWSILQKHHAVFDTSKQTMIRSDLPGHRIPIQPHHQPVHSYPYRRSPKETQIINEQVQEMLKNHVIRPSASPWASPVVIIKKKDGSPRFCVDYRRLNLITERDVYPLPRVDDIIDRLAGAQFFSTLDLKAGYWQLSSAEEDKKKTAFVTTEGLFEFNLLPFGLSNAPATLQRTINSILGSLRWDIALVYLDDIIVYSPSLRQHIEHLDRVLTVLDNANVKLNVTKCSLARKQLDYLGFRITPEGIKPTTTNVTKTLDFPTPTSTKAAYSFIQMAQFYRRFIKDFATIAAPLNTFKNKHASFVWSAACQTSFDQIKRELSKYPLLAFYNGKSHLKLKISTDASNVGIGGVLHQVNSDGRLQPIQYLSRALSPREQKYSVVEKECLAMVWSITKLRPYLYGKHFTLVTDHHPLCWLNKQSSKNGRLDRWSL